MKDCDDDEEGKDDGGVNKDDIDEKEDNNYFMKEYAKQQYQATKKLAAEDKKKSVEQIQPQIDNKENEEGKNDLDMEDLTKKKDDESNLMVKLKVDGQGIYLKKADYEAYQEAGIGENIPN